MIVNIWRGVVYDSVAFDFLAFCYSSVLDVAASTRELDS
jgi:hypothetical protein